MEGIVVGPVDALFDQALTWCLARLPVESVRLGREHRTVHAVDTSTVVRLRAKPTRSALVGKGYCHRAQRAVQANIVAALTTIVLIGGVRVGLVRRTRLGLTCQEAVASIFADLPPSPEKRLFSVDAGIATIEQFRTATAHDALVGRLRKNVTVRRAPQPQRPGKRGRPALHGPVLHPGAKRPEGRPDEDTTIHIEDWAVRVRRWRTLHFRETPQTVIDVVRVGPRLQAPLADRHDRPRIDDCRSAPRLWLSLARRDQFLCRPRHVCHGNAPGVECDRCDPAH